MSTLTNFDLHFLLKRMPVWLLELMKEHQEAFVVAGGYIRSIIPNEEVNDIDVFVSSEAKAKEYVMKLMESCPTSSRFDSKNACSIKKDGVYVQFIHRWVYKTPQEVVDSFDFTIAKAAIWFKDGKVQSVCHPDFYSDLAAKRLVYTSPIRNEDAGGSMLRVLKFYQRGYRIPLNSLGAVIARLNTGVKGGLTFKTEDESRVATVLTGLLIEVDPHANSHQHYLVTEEN